MSNPDNNNHADPWDDGPALVARIIRNALVALAFELPAEPEARIDLLRRAQRWCKEGEARLEIMLVDLEASMNNESE